MEIKFIINETFDYQDEFNYTIRSIFSDKDKDFFLKHQEELKKIYNNESYNGYVHEYNFGTNEGWEFNFDQIINMIKDSKQISENKIKILQEFGCACLDIFGEFKDRLDECIEEAIEFDEEILEEIKLYFGYKN